MVRHRSVLRKGPLWSASLSLGQEAARFPGASPTSAHAKGHPRHEGPLHTRPLLWAGRQSEWRNLTDNISSFQLCRDPA